jgi:hypothetical protein
MDTLVKNFCNRKYLKKRHVIRLEKNSYREYVYLEDPIVFARLAGEIKHRLGRPSRGYQVFMRGQTNDFSGMIPSLFRNIQNMADFSKLYSAYKDLGQQIKKISKAKRFEGEVGSAVLQHYGVKTPWLDLVDNIFIALWFACWERFEHKDGYYRFRQRNSSEFGWVYFLKFDYGNPDDEDVIVGKNTKYCDLRSSTESLVLRAHTQHGVFGSLNNLNYTNYDMNKYIVAAVRFPVENFINFLNRFGIITPNYMFPSDHYDNTYKMLHQLKISALVKRVESENMLDFGTLGTVDTYY